MIGSFWNLCRACPSMPVDKLHSEYRSTYKWHEFKSEQQQPSGGVVKQPAPNPTSALPIARGPIEPAMPRRKKYPGVAYRANEFFEPAPADGLRPVQQWACDRARARTVLRAETDRAGRRSKSEGPRQTRWTDTVEPKGTTATGDVQKRELDLTASTEYRNQFAWPKDTTDAPRKSISMGALKKAAAAQGAVEAEPLISNQDHGSSRQPKKFSDDYLWNKQSANSQRKSTFRSALSALISSDDRSKDNRKRYKSEYKKKFRPFSQYVFEASKGTFTKCRNKGKEVKGDGDAKEAMLGSRCDDHIVKEDQQPMSLPTSESWYQEVVESRKRAGEYKYRGWGTELAPEHITQLYNKQIELWQQVSRRSSLSALSLANTNHKALPRDEKDIKDSKNQSPKKFRSFRSAPHQSIHSKLQDSKSTERSPHKSPQKQQKKKLTGQSFDEGSNKDNKGEFRSPRRRPRSADPAPVTKHLPNGHEPHPRPHKPTGLPLNKAGSTNKVRSTTGKGGRSPSAPGKTAPVSAQNGEIPGQRRSRSVSKVGIKLDDDMPSHRSASVAKDQYFDDSPIVKSPPEPTRVKSPEQMNMRSPDPVNWTVPLDTGKTFTVTQNVKSDDTIKRPNSAFKGYGNSITEEGSPVKAAEIAPVHHQQMSPIRMKKSESPTNKRADKTPTTPISLTPIDETKALDINGINGHGINGVNGTTEQLTPDNQESKEVVKKSIEATQVAPGVVDTTLVNEPNTGGLSASEVLDRARNRFDKFWGKKEEDNV